jgi:hypothetical protein
VDAAEWTLQLRGVDEELLHEVKSGSLKSRVSATAIKTTGFSGEDSVMNRLGGRIGVD